MSKVKISARLRPKLPQEVDDGGIHVEPHSEAEGGGCVVVANPRDVTQIFRFPFSSAWPPSTTQDEIFNRDVRPLLDAVFGGVTVTIFAYGVTSSGKTHTMQGTPDEPGVIPRVLQELFACREALTSASAATTGVRLDSIEFSVSYMEIYKDECYDLFVARESAPKLPVRENEFGQVFVANLSTVPVGSLDEFESVYAKANKRRSTGSTNLNHASSRSHAVLTVEVAMQSGFTTRTGKINLVDLAGSENNKHTGNDRSRMEESSAINKSLSVLGQVVHALNSGASRIPYRDSKLTRILQDALGGQSVGLLICNLAPGTRFRQDTLNTLNFAVRTKNVENKPVVNERDSRPAPKPHFAAVQQKAPKLAPAALPATIEAAPAPGPAATAAPIAPTVPVTGHRGPRPSLAPRPVDAGSSKVPRRTSLAPGASTDFRFQPFALSLASVSEAPQSASSGGGGSGVLRSLTDEEIEERINKAVEKEVTRRLAERDRERARLEELEKELEKERSRRSEGPGGILDGMDRDQSQDHGQSHDEDQASRSLPAGVMTPILEKHADLDDELKRRLTELEKKMDHGDKELQLADVLSPTSKKKTGRAYVALARAQSEKGDLQVALDLYKKAQSYVPDNLKLQERILEIEWSVKNGKPFEPAPKKSKKSKHSKKTRSRSVNDGPRSDSHDHHDEDEDEGEEGNEVSLPKKSKKKSKRGQSVDFGTEVTNTKRSVDETTDAQTPAKKKRRSGENDGLILAETPGEAEDTDGEWITEVSRPSRHRLQLEA
ncbi:kinesin-domain-containing protein [Punctularia strigosozonata HHB-11173 SS5]|uniref:kinesin-domain-containing protein n=1 Tax=Punctularia strigosozonata (strain HHB-11173) TaxID=741275 RepID=UPI00044183BB|nr:kinesin-domain-containing protein [Punctularia strigosozonata HHB-11173 SS5]EIN08651.1 kinesin-domain-containing protein [Punctularia strigosozonata HHB-11173 SS5]